MDGNLVEDWSKFPVSQHKLYQTLLKNNNVKSPIIVSGDVHHGSLLRKDCRMKSISSGHSTSVVQQPWRVTEKVQPKKCNKQTEGLTEPETLTLQAQKQLPYCYWIESEVKTLNMLTLFADKLQWHTARQAGQNGCRSQPHAFLASIRLRFAPVDIDSI